MSVEQIFDDIDACRNQILSALGQDPNHDYRDGGRTYKQEDLRGRDIAKKMENLLTFCDRRRIASGGAINKVGGGSSNLGQLILSPEATNQEIMIIANNISSDFVKSTSNLIFSGGISLAIRASSVLTLPNTDGNYNENHNKSIGELLNYGNLQENFIGDALNILSGLKKDPKPEDLNKITTYKFVKSHYEPLFQALKDPINNNIPNVLASVENASILSLNDQVSSVLAGSGNTCLFDLDSAIALINKYATDENVNIPSIDINLFIQLSKADQISQLDSVLKKIKFKLHPDKNIGKSEDEKQEKEE